MENLLKLITTALPLLFALGFLGPVMAQGMVAAAIEAPFGLAPLSFSLIVAGAWGLFATITGRWI